MARYQYRVEVFVDYGGVSGFHLGGGSQRPEKPLPPSRAEERLNALGEEGWRVIGCEIVTRYPPEGGTERQRMHCLLMREVP